jgi:hypothetical protein
MPRMAPDQKASKQLYKTRTLTIQICLAPRKIQCSCGKTIEYIDRVVGGNNSQSAILICAKCQKEHEITFLGFLSEIKGASRKS